MNDWRRGLNELLNRVAQRDEQAFTWMYESIHRTAIATILAEVGGLDEDEAEAVYNRSMLKVWQKASTYEGRPEHDPDATAWAWIRTVILHTALDISRSLRKRAMAEVIESEMKMNSGLEEMQDLSPIDQLSADDVAPSERSADSPAALSETREGLAEYIRQLNPREQLIFRLLAEGQSQAEAAAHLGISAARMSQVVRTMRQKAEQLVRP